MLRTVVGVLVLAAFILAEPVAARTLVAFDDPAGDVAISNQPSDVPAPWADGIDVLHAELVYENESLITRIFVDDLSALQFTENGVVADTMFIFRWNALGVPREGDWRSRADYVPSNTQVWSFSAEGPCLVPQPDQSCAGGDRDIHEDLVGDVDYGEGSVTVVLPVGLIGGLSNETVLEAFEAETNMIWPSWPVYAGDRASDPSRGQVQLEDNGPNRSQFPADEGQRQDDPGPSSTTSALSMILTVVAFGIVCLVVSVRGRQNRP